MTFSCSCYKTYESLMSRKNLLMCAGASITPERKRREALRVPLSPSPSPELGLSVVINIRLTGHTAKIDLPQTCYNYFYCTSSCFSGL